MKLSQEQRQEIVNFLTTNCDCWKHQGDVELLNRFTDEKLLSLREAGEKELKMMAVANVAVSGFTDGSGNAYRVNPLSGAWEHGIVNEATPGSSAKAKGMKAQCDEEDMDDNADPDDDTGDDGDDEQETYVRRTNKKRMTGDTVKTNRQAKRQPEQPTYRTAEDWFRSAPAEVQNRLQQLQAIEQREKDAVISQLLANVSDPADKRAHYERLNRYPLDELHSQLAIMPKAAATEDHERNVGRAVRAANRRAATSRKEDDDVLTLPTTNWQEISTGTSASTVKQEQQVSNYADVDPDLDEDDWLRNAPGTIRSTVQNAMAIEGRERRRLIDQIIANVTDEDAADRLARRLQSKSIDELQDMVLLASKKDTPRASYFGASAPVGNTRPTDSDDVLPLPKTDWNEVVQQQSSFGRRA